MTTPTREWYEAKFEPRFVPEPNSGCWLWIGALSKGYGHVYPGYLGVVNPGESGRRQWPNNRLAHRVSYEHHRGEITPGMDLDHLCRTKCCVNPWHLEAVTERENTLRCEYAPAAINASKTHCKRGHEFTTENTIENGPGKNQRRCRRCHAMKEWTRRHPGQEYTPCR